MNAFDCIIIGAGPAGLSAAIQAKRQGLSVAIFEKDRPGGQALAANLVENYPGFPNGIAGRELMKLFAKQAALHGVNITGEEVASAEKTGDTFSIQTRSGKVFASRTLIAACGLRSKKIGMPCEEKFYGRYIFHYADPATVNHQGRKVVVIGSGDAAFDQAIAFSKCAQSVTIAMRGDGPACIKLLVDRAKSADVRMLVKHNPVSVYEMDDALMIKFATASGLVPIDANVVAACIGKESHTELLNTPALKSRPPGVFFAGDCRRNRQRHIAIAVGDGIAAAMDAWEYINANHIKTRQL